MHVIGTAGHVDHGKSSLIAALTGTHPDRLKEEQEREMTIDLGFASLTLPNGEEIGIVDVPGHRDFIENMLAGVGGIEAVLLVIAADEGVMPQTIEHLTILDLLDVQAGLVVLTKTDLVEDPEWLPLMETDIRKVIAGTSLENAPILKVSSKTKAGFPELLEQLGSLVLRLPPKPDLGRPRLPVDRVFSMAGFGTVVTGTLTDGRLAAGQEAEIQPSGAKARIRSLQTHGKKEDSAVPGSRTAVNLAGVEVESIRRGNVITYAGQYQATQRLDAQFRLLAQSSNPLRHHNEVKLFLGTAEVMANIRLLGLEVLKPGEACLIQLEIHEPILASRGDRFILRRPSPAETLGGGSVLDAHPAERHKRFEPDVLQRLQALSNGTPEEILFQANLRSGPVTIKELLLQSHLDPEQFNPALAALETAGQLVRLADPAGNDEVNDIFMTRPAWTGLQENVLAALTTYHDTFPLRRGMPREELRSRFRLSPKMFALAIQRWSQEGILQQKPHAIALPGHSVLFTPFQQVKVDRLMAKFRATPYSPPTTKECKAEVGEDIFTSLVESGELVAVSDEVVFTKDHYQEMVEKIRLVLLQKGQISLAEVRDLFNTSRRYAQPLLENMDRTGVTVREGDFRKIKPGA